MTQAAASNREDVEQLGRRFEEFRRTHPVRSRLPEELWAAATKLARTGRDRSDGAGAGCGSAEPAEVDESIRASRGSKAAQASTPASAQKRARCSRLRGTAGGEHRCGGELSGRSGIAARCETAAGVEGHSNQRAGRVDSRVCGVVSHAADHAADANPGGGGGSGLSQGHRLAGRVVPRQAGCRSIFGLSVRVPQPAGDLY